MVPTSCWECKHSHYVNMVAVWYGIMFGHFQGGYWAIAWINIYLPSLFFFLLILIAVIHQLSLSK